MIRFEREARLRAAGQKVRSRPDTEEHYGQAELKTVVKGDFTKKKRSRKGPNYTPASAWLPPRT